MNVKNEYINKYITLPALIHWRICQTVKLYFQFHKKKFQLALFIFEEGLKKGEWKCQGFRTDKCRCCFVSSLESHF